MKSNENYHGKYCDKAISLNKKTNCDKMNMYILNK